MKSKTVFLGADHAGFSLKEELKVWLLQQKYEAHDLSPILKPGDDYPEVGFRVAKAVAKDKNSRGILVCGSGVGVTIAANRVKGVRAVSAHSADEIKLAREHNDVSILTLSGWGMDAKQAAVLIKTFLTTPSSKIARHQRRVKQLG